MKTLSIAEKELGIVVPESDQLYFYHVSNWCDYIGSHFDTVFRGRIHSSIFSISTGLPTFIVAPDIRVLELSQAILIPHTDIFDL